MKKAKQFKRSFSKINKLTLENIRRVAEIMKDAHNYWLNFNWSPFSSPSRIKIDSIKIVCPRRLKRLIRIENQEKKQLHRASKIKLPEASTKRRM